MGDCRCCYCFRCCFDCYCCCGYFGCCCYFPNCRCCCYRPLCFHCPGAFWPVASAPEASAMFYSQKLSSPDPCLWCSVFQTRKRPCCDRSTSFSSKHGRTPLPSLLTASSLLSDASRQALSVT